MLDVGTQGVAVECRLYGVRTLTRRLDHLVSARIDAEGVVADATDHPVIARTAIEEVVAGGTYQCVVAVTAVEGVIGRPTGHDVVQRVAVTGEVGGAEIDHVLHVGAQCEAGQRGLYGIRPLTRQLDQHVPG
ncbi:hypothetical protein D3C85_1044670 [compost metagenome]